MRVLFLETEFRPKACAPFRFRRERGVETFGDLGRGRILRAVVADGVFGRGELDARVCLGRLKRLLFFSLLLAKFRFHNQVR